jgi:hypothetical protein
MSRSAPPPHAASIVLTSIRLKLESEQPAAKTTWPAKIAVEKAASMTRAPKRSTSTPPKKGSAMLGTEYSVYSRF